MAGLLTGGIQQDDQGQPLLYRNNHISPAIYSFDSEYLTKAPKNKFLFFIRFVKSNVTSAEKLATTKISSNSSSRTVGFYCISVDRPTVTYNTRTMNQYNKKRIIQTGHKFNPIRISFVDTVDGLAETLGKDYYKFYYGDPTNSSVTAWRDDLISSSMEHGNNGWGFQIPTATVDQKNFFSSMELYIFYNGTYDRYDLVNPKIQEFRSGNADYRESGGIHNIDLTLTYEGLVYSQNSVRVLSNTSMIDTFGFDKGSFYQPANMSVSDYGLYFATQVSFDDQSYDQESSNSLLSLSGIISVASTILGGNATMLQSYSGVFDNTQLGEFIHQNRGTISGLVGNTVGNSPVSRTLQTLAGLG